MQRQMLSVLSLMIGAVALTACQTSTTTITAAPQTTPTTQATVSSNMQPKYLPALATLQQLSNYKWQRDSQDNRYPLTVTFDLNGIAINAGCNKMQTQISNQNTKGQYLTLKTNPVASTMMACEPAITQNERQAIDFFDQQQMTIQLQPDANKPRLTLTNSTGQVMHFVGELTAEHRYGQKGQIAFLEVAAQKVACSAQNPAVKCLKVRELTYNAQGLKTKTGAWMTLTQDIENFQHDNNHSVIRVKKFTSQDPQTTPVVYVYDMTVEEYSNVTHDADGVQTATKP